MVPRFEIAPAVREDVPAVLGMIRGLAAYENLADHCVATEDGLADSLFGDAPAAEVLLGRENAEPVGFALFFYNFSTFLGRKGLYLEDLFVLPSHRGRGYGRALLVYLARKAVDERCGRFEWAVLDWNAPAIAFYQALGAVLLPDWRISRVTGESLTRLAAQPLFKR